MAIISIKVDSTAPTWLDVQTFNWTVGEIVDENLNEDNVDHTGNIKTNVVYTVESATAPLAQLGLTLERNGRLHGTILAFQGGTYQLEYRATNARGFALSQVNAAVISLGVTGPIWGAPPADVTGQEVGSLFSPIFMVDHILSDGNPAANEGVLYEDHDGVLSSMGLSVHGFTSEIKGTFIDNGNSGAQAVTIKATNQSGLSSTISFNITVIAVQGSSETPVFGGLYAGIADINGCTFSGVVPTWKAGGGTFFREMNDGNPISIDMILNFMSSDGGSPITGVRLEVGDTLPSGLDALNTNGLGFITGVYDLGVANPGIEIQLILENANGDSLPSPVFKFIYFDEGALPASSFTSIDAQEGSNDVFCNLPEPCFTDNQPNAAASYELGHVFKVNTVIRTPSFIASTESTARIGFTLSGAVFSANNTIEDAFTA